MNRIRLYQPADLRGVYDVCVKTGLSGKDATGHFANDDLLPDIYAGPYVAFDADLAFIVDADDHVAGYIIASADTRLFVDRYRRDWLPGFAAKYPLVNPPLTLNDRIIKVGHTPQSMIGPDVDEFPAHLHIDLLPELQGRGMGRTLMRALLLALRERGVPAVQLGVGESNINARGFYARLGFRPLPSSPDNELILGLPTDAVI